MYSSAPRSSRTWDPSGAGTAGPGAAARSSTQRRGARPGSAGPRSRGCRRRSSHGPSGAHRRETTTCDATRSRKPVVTTAVRRRPAQPRAWPPPRGSERARPVREPRARSSPRKVATAGVDPHAASTAFATAGSGGLDTSRIASVPGSASSARTADLAIRPPTSAERSRPPTPMTCETRRPTGPAAPTPPARRCRLRRRRPTGPRARAFAKPKPGAGQHGRAGARPHHEQAEVAGALLELTLLAQRHVVAEEQHVQAAAQRVVRLERGVLAGHRDDGDGCVALLRRRRFAIVRGAAAT